MFSADRAIGSFRGLCKDWIVALDYCLITRKSARAMSDKNFIFTPHQ